MLKIKASLRYAKKIPLKDRRRLLGERTLEAVKELNHAAIAKGILEAIVAMTTTPIPGCRHTNHIDTGMSAASLAGILQDKRFGHLETKDVPSFERIMWYIAAYKKREFRDRIRDANGNIISRSGVEDTKVGLDRTISKVNIGTRPRASMSVSFKINVYQYAAHIEDEVQTLMILRFVWREYIRENAARVIKNKRVLAALVGE